MAILCCCSQLRSKKRPEGRGTTASDQDPGGLPVRPPPARLPPATSNALALSPRSVAARSSLTDPLPGAAAEALVQPGELVVDDSEDDNCDDGLDHGGTDRTTTALGAVKARIRRHLSQDSISRRSETEEQMAHRAKVKHLMRKRIQEELQSETDGTVGAVSIPHVLVPAPHSVALLGGGPRDTIEFTVSETQEKELARAEAAHLSSVSAQDDEHCMPTSAPERSSAQSLGKENRHPSSRAASLRDWNLSPSAASQADCHKLLRNRSSLPEIPAPPVLCPARVPSFNDTPSFTSWRLSLSTEKLADLITPGKAPSLSQQVASSASDDGSVSDTKDDEPTRCLADKSSSLAVTGPRLPNRLDSSHVSLTSSLGIGKQIPPSQSLIRGDSPVGLWLRTQSQQFRFSAASQASSEHASEAEDADDMLGGPAEPCRPDTAVRGLPGRPHHMRENQQLERQGSLQSTRNKTQVTPTLSEAHRPILDADIDFVDGDKDPRCEPRNDRIVTVPFAAKSKADHKLAQADASPIVPRVVRKGLAGLRLPSFKCTSSSYPIAVARSVSTHHSNVTGNHFTTKSEGKANTGPPPDSRPGDSSPSLASSNTRRTTMDTASETSSFFHREAELRNVEERFRDSHLRKAFAVPVESRFREDFDEETRLAERNSLVSEPRLNLPLGIRMAFHNFDGSGTDAVVSQHAQPGESDTRQNDGLDRSGQGHLEVPIVGRGNNGVKRTSRPRGFSSSRDGDETAELWKRALRGEPGSTSHRRSASSHLPATGNEREERPGSRDRLPQAPQPSEDSRRSVSESHAHSPTCNTQMTQEDEEAFRRSLLTSNKILEEWARQLDNQELEAKSKTRPLSSAPQAVSSTSKIPPESWAKYPSFNREQRNAAAGVADGIMPKDFAVREISAAGHITWTTDTGEASAQIPRNMVRSFSDKFTQPFRTRLGRFMPGRSTTPTSDKSMRGARRSSIQTSGDLEYPELELLPTAGGYKELRALERGINEIAGLAGSIRTDLHEDDALNNRPKLTEKMVGALQHDGSSENNSSKTSDITSFVERQATCVIIHSQGTPATQIRHLDPSPAKDSTGSSGQRYATPLTHLSSCPDGLSRPVTPCAGPQRPPTAHTPSSTKSSPSVVRRIVLGVPTSTSDDGTLVVRSRS